ncbi:hypothetical protein I2I11_15390 [Pontibacter sp. 172403-2]|uniref:hypothetical protein n=1 Tax=Pontibacter rufus TaxID=2791028 RepID=UPI0018AFF7F0|nr:hypothetical protein [Pontibacter sp. 172403-2]MBF9254688.1 hypothetical protein [Pontibacter sp. 172403-2]
MAHSYVINSINGLVLILVGLTRYVVIPDQPVTALAVPVFGLLLLACTYHLRKHNRFVFHTVTSLTLLAAVLLSLQVSADASWSTQDVLLLLMGLSCFIATLFFVGSFVRERRLRDRSVYKDDL